MDADDPHEPEVVPDFAESLLDSMEILVTASRNVRGTYLFFDENLFESTILVFHLRFVN